MKNIHHQTKLAVAGMSSLKIKRSAASHFDEDVPATASEPLNIKPKVHDIAFLHDVFLTLKP